VGKAMDPCAQRGRGKVQRVRDRLEAVPLDDVAHGLGTPKHAGLFGLLQERLSSGKGIIGKVAFEGPHSGGLREKTTTKIHCGTWILLSEHSLFDSNFSGAAQRRGDSRSEVVRLVRRPR